MSTITKEWLQQAINDYESVRDELPFGLDDYQEKILASLRIALASLEAEPVAWRYRTTDIKGNPNPGWSFSEEASLLGLYQPVFSAPPAPVSVPDDIDARMKNAGMLSAAEIIAGQPIDAFMKHAGVVDLSSLLKWAEMRRAEFLRMQAKYELGDNQKDDMYEWVISHVAAFSELHVNLRAAMLQGAEPVMTACKLPEPIKDNRLNSGPDADDYYSGYQAGWNELLEAVSGNSPVIPDGWVSVIDQTPDEYDFDIWVFSPSIGVQDGVQWDGLEFADDEYQFRIKDVSHWMKKIYPAAPQKEG
ncbi:hypothetical protein [Enterobacter cloacae]|uniref:hypothetical protein n=1 Tax=Enterobacter cloacae TaxID=550 RepID=UPI000ADB7E8E|nr:hypothetical protein [Enterobacter cloacae]